MADDVWDSLVECSGDRCDTTEGAMNREINGQRICLCPDCADEKRALGTQDRGSAPPAVPERTLFSNTPWDWPENR